MTLTAQQSRVLRWAQRTGKVCTSDFTPPDVCDGGGEITRVPARVIELSKMGYGFKRDGTSKGFAVWKLTSVDPVVALRAEPEPSMWVAPEPEPEPQVPIHLEFVMCANDDCGRIVGHPEPSRRCYCREPQEITMVLDIQPAMEARAAA